MGDFLNGIRNTVSDCASYLTDGGLKADLEKLQAKFDVEKANELSYSKLNDVNKSKMDAIDSQISDCFSAFSNLKDQETTFKSQLDTVGSSLHNCKSKYNNSNPLRHSSNFFILAILSSSFVSLNK